MQLFVNNWTGTLMAGIGASDTELEIESASAARLTGLGSGDYYLLTLARVEGGQEVAWEVVKVTDRAGAMLSVERGQEGTAALPWPSGTALSLRVTAGTLLALQESGGGGGDGGIVIVEGFGAPNAAPPSKGAIYIQTGEYGEYPLYIAAGDLNSEDWVGPLASYTGRQFVELQAPETVGLPVSIGRVLAHPALEDPPGEFRLRLPAAARLRNEHMLEFSVSVVADPGSTLVIAAPTGSTASFSVSGPAVGHTASSSALTIPMQTMELRVSYCRAYDGQLQVHVLVQHLEP